MDEFSSSNLAIINFKKRGKMGQDGPNWPSVVRNTVMRYGLEKKYTFLYLIIQILWEGHTNLVHPPVIIRRYLIST